MIQIEKTAGSKQSMKANNPKVLILAAGRGKRMGNYSLIINKALLPINGKAIISHIIEKFPADYEFVVATGYKSNQVLQYLKMAHPECKFNLVFVANYDGPGSGPGLSALSCKEYLNQSFYFVSCDTLWTESVLNFGSDANWIAIAEVSPEDSSQYCNAVLNGNNVTELIDKQRVDDRKTFAFCGLCFVKDHELFWEGLENNTVIQGEKQISNGLNNIIKHSTLSFCKLTWTDTGTEKKYIEAVKKFEKFDFTKTNEFVFLLNNRVIKFFNDTEIVKKRIEKAAVNPTVFPRIISFGEDFYSYEYVKGNTLYQNSRPETFQKLLAWLSKSLWQPFANESSDIQELCKIFYFKKTEQRLKLFSEKYSDKSFPEYINNVPTPSAELLLQQLNKQELQDGIAYFIHGDLQPDNIIYDEVNDSFCLLDWRQDFAGQVRYGDIYYDFAKLWGGLNLNYDQIKQNNFHYEESEKFAVIKTPQHPNVDECTFLLEDFLKKHNFNITKVKILVGLIYLNMSPLHNYPFDRLLHAMGRKFLFETLKGSLIDKS
jgi:NDP-sugar pyrophosphorylase family protein